MSIITCTRRIQFCAGHRVVRHESKCRNLHGHNYVVFIEARPEAGLDEVGRVIDFSVLKEKIGGWIERNWDHGLLLWEADAAGKLAVEAFNKAAEGGAQKLFFLPSNPTAENMAEYLLHEVCPGLLKGSGVFVSKITIQETENCSAEAILG